MEIGVGMVFGGVVIFGKHTKPAFPKLTTPLKSLILNKILAIANQSGFQEYHGNFFWILKID
jgi:hypothetical protein